MLGLEPGNRCGPGGTGRAVVAHAAHFVFGGVAFELLADSASQPQLGAALECYVLPLSVAEGLPQVVVALSWDRQLPAPRERNHFAERAAADTELSSRHLRGRLCPLGPGRYALHARVAPGLEGLTGLLLAANAAVVQREGGLCLQATALEADGRALLVIGSNAADTSDACDLIEGARCLARERVTLTPAPDAGFEVWALPDAQPSRDMPLSAHAALPLAGVLRVRRHAGQSRIERLVGSAALVAVHEALQTTLADGPVYERQLGALQRLCETVPVGVLDAVLHRPLGALVRGFLGGSSPAAAKSA